MRGKILKKLIALTATASMLAQFTAVIPANAAEIKTENINDDYSVSVTDNGQSLSIPVKNNSDKSGTVSAYVATYASDIIEKLTVDSKTVDAGANETLNVTYEQPQDGKTVKLFIWADNNKPVIKTVELGEIESDTSIYAGTPAWTVVGGSTEMRDNLLYSDRTQSKTASVHIQGGTSGDRYAYATIIPDGVTSDESNLLKLDFYLNIAGSNSNASHFYIMSQESKTNPESGIIMDLQYSSYLGNITVNGTEIDNLAVESSSDLRPTSEAKYEATGLVHYTAIIDMSLKKIDLTIEGETTKTYTVDFVDKSANSFVGFASLQGRALSGLGIADVNAELIDRGETIETCVVTYSVDGNETTEIVKKGENVVSIPETDKTGYAFKGWAKDDDTENLLTTEQLLSTAITSDVKFTAVYEEDTSYIESIASVVVSGPESMTFGPDPNTAAQNTYTVTITGEQGTVITADTVDKRVTDFKVEWDVDGFKTKSDNEGQYCDSYGAFSENNTTATTVDFNLKNVPMNFFGKMTAKVTYNGNTYTASQNVIALGNTTVDSKQILPRGGYPSDFDEYPSSMVGYVTKADTFGGDDSIVGGWNMAGSDGARKAEIVEEDGNKFMKITAGTTKKSHMLSNQIASPATQAIFEQNVRFNSSYGVITLTSGYPIWQSSKYACPVSVQFNGSTILLNGTKITKNEEEAAISKATWYKVVLSVDKTTETAFVKVYDMSGNLVGEADNVAWTISAVPTYYSIGLDNSYAGTIDFDKYKAYYPTADNSAYTLVSTQDTLSIPNGDTAVLTASLKSTEGYDITGAAAWSVLEDDMREGVIITPDETDSHKATVTLSETATAGEATVQVSINGITKTIKLNITSSAESVKFTQSKTSVSIPLDTSSTTTANYSAIVIDGNGTDLKRDVTFAVYDKTNTNEYTLPEGITFNAETGELSVMSNAIPCTFTIRASGLNSDNGIISKGVKVTVHGLAFDFGAGTDEDLAEGYTAITPETTYSEERGYGIEGVATAGGTASTDNANSDYLEGNNVVFKAKVEPAKVYEVTITYQGVLDSEYVNSDLVGARKTIHNDDTGLAEKTYTIPVVDDVLDLTISSTWTTKEDLDGDNKAETTVTHTTSPRIASISIVKCPDKTANAIPNIYHVGDSTSANNGSWAYRLSKSKETYPELFSLCTFYNKGAGGRNLCSYYSEGKLQDVLSSIAPGDIVMFGNNGTNGMGSYFEDDVNYYLDAAEAMGAKIILNSYTGHGYPSNYDAETNTFNMWRQDSYDVIVRRVAEERAASDPNYLGFVEIGKNADAIFNSYAADYAANGYADEDAAAAAVISCFTDHNHYSNGTLACDLMLGGYSATTTPGIVAQLVDILSNMGN